MALAVTIGISAAAMERLVKRHRRELRAYGPVIKGQEAGEFYVTSDQIDLLRLVSESPIGVAERATLLTTAALAMLGLNRCNPDLPAFKTPDEVRRFAAAARL